ncbi:hypothetical protein EJ05DRAFT_165831 [Pseudovirgaria hyperparasitica]|uniref:Mid2 domain-containing protein n=1 Tax=Pseudovirgaria hyperparasitica TaxID=470096 RepID=A0A6A6VUP6_9PEZI|nr:uncharacterized protein EJ05DRAFT_165831 [Pseudovirgaria hyperparasitica]KAF2753609.1 hypothetical protein EJ05DRAFT_165831 [Pseudovirgaria hyperparasitica]
MRVYAAYLGLVPALTQAAAFPGPLPTQYRVQKIQAGWNPKPTQAPSLELFMQRRDIGIDPNTCGWVDGQSDGAVQCPAGNTCMLYTPDNIVGMAGCCSGGNLQNCGWNTGCVDQENYSTACNDPSCFNNPFIVLCTDSSAPFCVSWTYPGDQIQDHGCGTDAASTWQTVEKDISTDGITTSLDLTYVPEESVTGWRAEEQSTLYPTVTAGQSSQRSSRSSSTNALITGGSSNPNFDYSDRRSRVLSIGAIVGIVIGGISALAVIIGAIIFVFWDRRRKRRNAAAAQYNPTQSGFNNGTDSTSYMPQGPPPPMQQYGQSPPVVQEYYGQDNKSYPQASPQPQYAQPYPSPSVSPHPQAAVPVPAPYHRGSAVPSEQDGLRPRTILGSDGNSPVSAIAHSPVNGPPVEPPSPNQPPPQSQVHELG